MDGLEEDFLMHDLNSLSHGCMYFETYFLDHLQISICPDIAMGHIYGHRGGWCYSWLAGPTALVVTRAILSLDTKFPCFDFLSFLSLKPFAASRWP